MLKRLQQAWKRDRLGVLGVGSAVVALLLWALPPLTPSVVGVGQFWPIHFGTTPTEVCDSFGSTNCTRAQSTVIGLVFIVVQVVTRQNVDPWFNVWGYNWFSQGATNLPAIAAFLALAFILLLLRRR